MADELDGGLTQRGFGPGQRVFDRYKLEKILGRGATGVVWLALDEKLECQVALKFLPDSILQKKSALDELKHETRRNLDLTHPHIVRIYDFVQDGQHAAIAMEHVPGTSLAARKMDQPKGIFPNESIQRWIHQLIPALVYAHESAQVVHRDLKPGNLLIDSEGNVKVADFGLARGLQEAAGSDTTGTPAYMSPEQLLGEKSTVSDDIYSLGATLYELLTGKPPFYSGNIALQVQYKVPPRIRARRQELEAGEGETVPEQWETTIATCLAKSPEERPRTMRALLARLEGDVVAGALLRGVTTAPKPPPPAPPVAPIPVPVVTPPPPPPLVVAPTPPPVPPPAPPPPAVIVPPTPAPVAPPVSPSPVTEVTPASVTPPPAPSPPLVVLTPPPAPQPEPQPVPVVVQEPVPVAPPPVPVAPPPPEPVVAAPPPAAEIPTPMPVPHPTPEPVIPPTAPVEPAPPPTSVPLPTPAPMPASPVPEQSAAMPTTPRVSRVTDYPNKPQKESKPARPLPWGIMGAVVAVLLLFSGYYFGLHRPAQQRQIQAEALAAEERARLAQRLDEERQQADEARKALAAQQAQLTQLLEEQRDAQAKRDEEERLRVAEQVRLAEEAAKAAAAEAKRLADELARREAEALAAEEAAKARGGALISSNPPGAEVFSGTTLLGKTPLAFRDRPVGEESLVVKLAGHKDWIGKVEIKANDFSELEVKLVVDAFTENQLERRPEPQKQVAPDYPDALQRAGIGGTVEIEFIVDPVGNVIAAYPVKPGTAALDEAAIAAVRQWKFQPGMRGGRAVNVRMRVPIVFNVSK